MVCVVETPVNHSVLAQKHCISNQASPDFSCSFKTESSVSGGSFEEGDWLVRRIVVWIVVCLDGAFVSFSNLESCHPKSPCRKLIFAPRLSAFFDFPWVEHFRMSGCAWYGFRFFNVFFIRSVLDMSCSSAFRVGRRNLCVSSLGKTHQCLWIVRFLVKPLTSNDAALGESSGRFGVRGSTRLFPLPQVLFLREVAEAKLPRSPFRQPLRAGRSTSICWLPISDLCLGC